ncbi:MAG: hypothetical protein WCO60_11430 [Verrucomicrobiota bacterium]
MSKKPPGEHDVAQNSANWIFEKDAHKLVLDVVKRMGLPTALDDQNPQRISTLVDIAIAAIDACYEGVNYTRQKINENPEAHKRRRQELKTSLESRAAADRIREERITQQLGLSAGEDKVSFAQGRTLLCDKSGKRDREMPDLMKILERAYDQHPAFFPRSFRTKELTKSGAVAKMLNKLEADGFRLRQLIVLFEFVEDSVKEKLGLSNQATSQHSSE